MITRDLYDTLSATEQKLWHSHVFEVKSGMLIMPGPSSGWPSPQSSSSSSPNTHPAGSVLRNITSLVSALGPQQAWEAAETAEMEKVVHLYGKIYHLWQTDRGDELPLGEPQLMTSFTEEGQFDFERVVEERDGRFGVSHGRKRELRRGIEEPEVRGNADWAWKSRRRSL
jgi:hypothetical protein